MALNDKLINYEDISTFHSNLINDSSVSVKSTWSSDKINSELSSLIQNSVDNDSIVLDASNHISVSQELINYIVGIEQRVYALEHPTTVE